MTPSITPQGGELDTALRRATRFLLERQAPEGYWVGFLETDTSPSAEYVLLTHYVGRVNKTRCRKILRHLKRTRNEEGGWEQAPGGASHLDTTLVNYVSLAVAGEPEDAPGMRKTRHLIRALGGLGAAHFFTRILLGFFGVFPFRHLPWVTSRLFDNTGFIYRQGIARTIFVPYMVLYELRAVRDFSDRLPLALELWGSPRRGLAEDLFQRILAEFASMQDPGRTESARDRCLTWIAERQERDGTWGGVFQTTLFSLMCLHASRDPRWEGTIRRGLRGVESFQVERGGEVIQQFSVSPVMDTAYAVRALCRTPVLGRDARDAARKGSRWLASKQVSREGDWKHNNPEGRPGGWSFEFHNTWYPDLDCSSMVLDALAALPDKDRRPLHPHMDRGLDWVLSMQSRDGGFAVWDKNNWLLFQILSRVLDVGDYSQPDITARVVTALASLQRLSRYRNRVDIGRALHAAKRFLWAQGNAGRWYGRWGVNYTYGTGQVLAALGETGTHASHRVVRQAVRWLRNVQNPDGGWGEGIESYELGRFAPAPSTAAQTAIVLSGFLGVGMVRDDAVIRGIRQLLDTQGPEGMWDDRRFFAVNIPRVWYGRYELIPTLISLKALAAYRRLHGETASRR